MAILRAIRWVGDVGSRGYKAVLGIRNARGEQIGCVFVVIEIELFDNGFEQVFYIRRLINRKTLREAYLVGILAQDSRKDRVERAHTQVATARAYHCLAACTHLLGSFVGKCQCQNIIWCHTLLNHIGYARGQHTGLSGAGTGYDKRGRVVVHDCITLRWVESL